VIDANFPSLSVALAGSWLGRSMVGAVSIAASAWQASRLKRWITGASWVNTGSVARVALAGAAIALAVQPALPHYTRSILPLFWPAGALLMVAVIAVWPAAFTRAWPRSTLVRIVRRSLGGAG